MTTSATIAARLQKLILLLSSDQPGEVAAAAAAIDRQLRAMGADWHIFARALTRDSSPSTAHSPSQTPPRMKPSRLMARWLLDHRGDRLSPREFKFCHDMQRWTRPTSRQSAWLSSIFESFGGQIDD